jgi:hypothetical protein
MASRQFPPARVNLKGSRRHASSLSKIRSVRVRRIATVVSSFQLIGLAYVQDR